MEYKKFNNTFVVRIDKGEEVVAALKRFCEDEDIKSGSFSGIGAVSKVVLGFFDPARKKFVSKEFVGKYEVISLVGNISQMKGEPYLHCHITMSHKNFTTLGGHLSQAIVSTTLEVVLVEAEGEVGRVFNKEIGLNLMEF